MTAEGGFPRGLLGRVLDPNFPGRQEVRGPLKHFLSSCSHESPLVQLSRGLRPLKSFHPDPPPKPRPPHHRRPHPMASGGCSSCSRSPCWSPPYLSTWDVSLLVTQGSLGPVPVHTFVKPFSFGIFHDFSLSHLLYLVLTIFF